MSRWKKFLITTFCTAIGVYLLLAVTAFNNPADANEACKGVHISITKDVIDGYLTPQEVTRMLNTAGINPEGKPLAGVNLRTLEERLEAEELIDHAECYRTQDGRIDISISERIPVMRVMARSGDDYYVDKDGRVMQNTGYTCNLPVATGNVTRSYASRVLAPIGRLVMADDFWRNQVVQLNVLADSTLEMVPRVGNHVVYLGRPTGISKKLERLRKFYQYGLNQVGWNKYRHISVEFDNQIVCKRR